MRLNTYEDYYMGQNKRKRDQGSKLWVVTSYYNPAGYKARRVELSAV